MHVRSAVGMIAALLMLSGAGVAAQTVAPQPAPDAQASEDAPGEGVICVWALLVVSEEAGRQCFPGQDADFQAELHDSVGRLDRYVMANGKASQSDIDDFKRKQGHVGEAKATLCQGDPVMLYRNFRDKGASAIHALTDKLTARPGEPTLGSCT